MIINKNFLFVIPRYANKNEYYPFPYGLGYVVANMKKNGFNVFVLNLCHHDGPVGFLLSESIEENSVDVVCTGAMSLHWIEVEEILNAVKEFNKDVITVVGGAIVTSDPVLALENLKIDYGVIEEKEETMVELADALCNNKNIGEVKGICFLDKKEYFLFTGRRQQINDLDSLPFPDYDGLEFDKWLDVCSERKIDVTASRSCPFHCTFCYHPLGNNYRQRSLDNVFMEIDYLKKRYDILLINIQDEVFSLDKERIYEFAHRIKEYDIPWMVQWRIDNIDEDLLKVLKESNLYLLELGVESYSDVVLDSMKKGITKKQIKYAYDLCDKVGVNVTSNIILGDIAETEETVKESLDFVKSHPEHEINIGFILAIPCSELWLYAFESGKIKDKLEFIKRRFPVINLTGMSNRKFNGIKKRVMIINIIKKYRKQKKYSLSLCLKILGILLLSENGLLYLKLKNIFMEL